LFSLVATGALFVCLAFALLLFSFAIKTLNSWSHTPACFLDLFLFFTVFFLKYFNLLSFNGRSLFQFSVFAPSNFSFATFSSKGH